MSRWLQASARRNPQGVALEFRGHCWSYEELAQEVDAAAALLIAKGVRPGDRVALAMSPGPLFVIRLHALWQLGACAVPLNLRLTEQEQESQRLRILPRLVLHDHCPWGAEVAPVAPSEASETPALLLFTSGTTGRAKMVALGAGALEASALASRQRLGTDAWDRWLLCLPLFHIGGLSILVRAVLDGSAVVLQEHFDLAALDDAIEEGGVTRLSLVPTTLKRLLDWRGNRAAPLTLRSVLIGGAPASPALLERAKKAGLPVQPTYGMTETASQCATLEPGGVLDGRVGQAMPGACIRIATGDGKEAPLGEEGEIQVRGSLLFSAYWADEEATRAAFVDGWFRTGDIGRIGEDGALFVLDRRSDLLVTGGENVAPAEVESVLQAHPQVAEVAVWGTEDEDLGHRVTAWLVSVQGELDVTTLDRYCREHLAAFKVPREYRLVTALPRNAMGKVNRRELSKFGDPVAITRAE